MGKKSSPSPPPAVDPVALANAQSASNVATAKTGNIINNPNQITPFGSRSFSDADPSGRYTVTDALNPAQQNIVDSDARTSLALSDLAGSQATKLQGVLDTPYTTGGLPGSGTVPTQEGLQPLPGENLTAIPGADDFGAERTRVEDAVVGRFNRFSEPNIDEDRESLLTRLSNQGHSLGGVAYGKAIDRFDRGADSLRADVQDRAVLAGGAEQSRIFNDALAARGTQFGEQAQRFGLDINTQSQLFGLNQAARERALQEGLAIRNQPINEIAALLGTGQVNLPQFAGISTQAVAPTDTLGFNQLAQNSQLAQFNAQAARQRANVGAVADIAGAGLGAYGSYLGRG